MKTTDYSRAIAAGACGFAMAMIVAVSPAALGQSDIPPAHASAWGENIGWLNWRHERPDPGDGVLVADTFLGGFVWGENVGWISLGDGDPGPTGGAETAYANVDGTDFGVNLDPGTGALSGYAWGENIGWINFGGGALAVPPNAARLDEASCRFRGYAWGENVGWINLDDATHYVGVLIDGDVDSDGDVELADLAVLLANFGTAAGATREDGDFEGDGDVELADLAILLANFGRLCG